MIPAAPHFVDRCLSLEPGKSAPKDALPYTIHRYGDGWWALWHQPPTGNLGRRLRNEQELRKFMSGDMSAGALLQ
jgi:hypothetical protein